MDHYINALGIDAPDFSFYVSNSLPQDKKEKKKKKDKDRDRDREDERRDRDRDKDRERKESSREGGGGGDRSSGGRGESRDRERRRDDRPRSPRPPRSPERTNEERAEDREVRQMRRELEEKAKKEKEESKSILLWQHNAVADAKAHDFQITRSLDRIISYSAIFLLRYHSKLPRPMLVKSRHAHMRSRIEIERCFGQMVGAARRFPSRRSKNDPSTAIDSPLSRSLRTP